MTWQQTTRHLLRRSPEQVYAVLSRVDLWPRWCPGLVGARLDGPLGVGQTGAIDFRQPVIRPVHRLTAPPIVVREVVPGRRLLVEQPQPGGALWIAWDLEVTGQGLTQWTQRILVNGPLTPGTAPVAQRSLGRRVHLQAARLYALAGGAADPELTKVVIAGGSGALGSRLAADLVCRGHDVVVLTRARSADPVPGIREVEWDGRTVGAWADELSPGRHTGLVNLAGRLVDLRPSVANVASLTSSRVDATRALVAASRLLDEPLAHWVQGSTTAIYSDAGERRLDEASAVPVGLPQMTGVAQPWEAAAMGAHAAHAVLLRSALVLARDTPVMERLLGVTRAGLGGPIGDGRQWFSWIHLEDWLTVVRAALGLDPELELPGGSRRGGGASPGPQCGPDGHAADAGAPALGACDTTSAREGRQRAVAHRPGTSPDRTTRDLPSPGGAGHGVPARQDRCRTR